MKKKIILSLGIAAVFSVAACKKTTDPVVQTPAASTFTATLNGINSKPSSTSSPATGNFNGTLNTTTNVLSYTLSLSGFPTSSTVTMAHLHRVNTGDAAGVNGVGPPEIPILSVPMTGTSMSGTVVSSLTGNSSALTAAKIDSMNRGFYYANVHTNDFPNGAIRGNVTKR